MSKPKRILKNIDVAFISLVNKGANGKEIIFKSSKRDKPNLNKSFKIIKTDDEKHLVYGTVYEPDEVDSQGDTASAEVIEKAAHNFLFLLKNKNVDTQHDFVADDGAVVESFILRAADPMFPDTKIGSWVVAIKVSNDETWALVKSGEITGLSLAGLAATETPEEKSDTSLLKDFAALLKKHFGPSAAVQKDFDAELKAAELRQKVWALQDAIYKVMNDEDQTTEQKQAAVLESIDQFRASVASEPVSKSNQGESMTEQDLNKVVAKVNDALKPHMDQVKKIGDDVTALTGRLEAVEKATPGSLQPAGDPVKKEDKPGFWV